MNSHWLTILMSKGIELEKDLRLRLKQEIESRGIRWSWVELASTLEEISPKVSHAAMSYALNFLKPFSAGLGIRISQLSDKHIEAIIPFQSRNLNSAGCLHEGALTTTAVEAFQILWLRLAPMGQIHFIFDQIQLDLFQPIKTDCRIRIGINEDEREKSLTALRVQQKNTVECFGKFYDEKDQLLGEIKVLIKMTHEPRIENNLKD